MSRVAVLFADGSWHLAHETSRHEVTTDEYERFPHVVQHGVRRTYRLDSTFPLPQPGTRVVGVIYTEDLRLEQGVDLDAALTRGALARKRA